MWEGSSFSGKEAFDDGIWRDLDVDSEKGDVKESKQDLTGVPTAFAAFLRDFLDILVEKGISKELIEGFSEEEVLAVLVGLGVSFEEELVFFEEAGGLELIFAGFEDSELLAAMPWNASLILRFWRFPGLSSLIEEVGLVSKESAKEFSPGRGGFGVLSGAWGLGVDFLTTSFGIVNFREIAEEYTEEILEKFEEILLCTKWEILLWDNWK